MLDKKKICGEGALFSPSSLFLSSQTHMAFSLSFPPSSISVSSFSLFFLSFLSLLSLSTSLSLSHALSLSVGVCVGVDWRCARRGRGEET
jgi:hypothetical protein